MNEIKFIIDGEPVAKGRPRFYRRGRFMGTYTPANTKNAEQDIKYQILKYKPTYLIGHPIILEVYFYRSIPKMSKKNRELALNGGIMPTKRPDIDNYLKTIFDAFNGIIWADDSQVVSVTAGKYYSNNPRTEVKINY